MQHNNLHIDLLFFRASLNCMLDGVCFSDRSGTITLWNKSAERLTGYSEKEVIGKHCSDTILKHLKSDGSGSAHINLIEESMRRGAPIEDDVYIRHKYGHLVSVTARTAPVRIESGCTLGAVEVFACNSKMNNILKEIEALRKEILTDQLTGIGSRRFADIILNSLIVAWREHEVPFGVFFVDIDNFKNVNDTWGHEVGDKILFMVAQTLANGLRGLDVACRWGGEEFLILIPNINIELLLNMGNRLRALIENCSLDHSGQSITVTASFGGAVSQKDDTISDVIARADKQLYLSKITGRNCVKIDKYSSSP